MDHWTIFECLKHFLYMSWKNKVLQIQRKKQLNSTTQTKRKHNETELGKIK